MMIMTFASILRQCTIVVTDCVCVYAMRDVSLCVMREPA